MQFEIKDLTNFLYSVQNNNIQQISLKSSKLDIFINKKYVITNQHLILKNNTLSNVLSKPKNFQENKSKIVTHQSNIPQKTENNESEIYSTIISPMVGTFYQSPAPNEPAFIKKHDVVQKKQIVCIIEAMKLMNEIEAEVNGEIVDILVNDGDIVDCGQALMKVKIK